MNIFDNTQKIITAKRLKELRNSKNLSHEKLSEELKQNGIEISIQALKDYEVVNEFHSKFNSTKGMSIEKLFGLAKFYNVSTDYLLGISDHTSPDTSLQGACEYLGLDENSIQSIRTSVFANLGEEIANTLFCSKEFADMLNLFAYLKDVTFELYKNGHEEISADTLRYQVIQRCEKILDTFDYRVIKREEFEKRHEEQQIKIETELAPKFMDMPFEDVKKIYVKLRRKVIRGESIEEDLKKL